MASEFEYERASTCESQDTNSSSTPYRQPDALPICDVKNDVASVVKTESTDDKDATERCSSNDVLSKSIPSIAPLKEKIFLDEEPGDVELGNFFLEDAPGSEVSPPEILIQQKKDKMREISSGKNFEILDGIWKKVRYTRY